MLQQLTANLTAQSNICLAKGSCFLKQFNRKLIPNFRAPATSCLLAVVVVDNQLSNFL